MSNPTTGNQHHPSCRESDKDLVWHCGQCGLNESAADIEQQLAAAVEALKAIRKHAEGENYKRCLGCSFTFNSADAALAKIGGAK